MHRMRKLVAGVSAIALLVSSTNHTELIELIEFKDNGLSHKIICISMKPLTGRLHYNYYSEVLTNICIPYLLIFSFQQTEQ